MLAPRGLDRVAHSRARDRARWLVRDHGADAEAVLGAKIARPGNSRADRTFYRMVRRELQRLRSIQAAASPDRRGLIRRVLAMLRRR